MIWKRLLNWSKARVSTAATVPDPYYEDRMRLQEQNTALRAQVSTLLEMVNEATQNERRAYQSMVNTLAGHRFSAPPFPNAAVAPANDEDNQGMIESEVVSGSSEMDRQAELARAELRRKIYEYGVGGGVAQ